MPRKFKNLKAPRLPLSRKVITLLVALGVLVITVTYVVSLVGVRWYVDRTNLFAIRIPNTWSTTKLDDGVQIRKHGGELALEIVVRHDPAIRPSVLFSEETQKSIREKYSKGYKIKPSEVTFGSAFFSRHTVLVVHFADKSEKGKTIYYTQYHILKGQDVYVVTRNNKTDASVLNDLEIL